MDLIHQVIQLPAIQGIAISILTEVFKKAPVGPTGGPGIRLFAAILAVASTLARAAATGDLSSVNPEEVGGLCIEALSAFLVAVGAWQVSKKETAQ